MEGEAVGDAAAAAAVVVVAGAAAAAAAVVTPLAALVAGGRQEGDVDLRMKVHQIQVSAERWALGCVNPASWLPLMIVRFTQPRVHLLADPCR